MRFAEALRQCPRPMREWTTSDHLAFYMYLGFLIGRGEPNALHVALRDCTGTGRTDPPKDTETPDAS